MRNHCRAVVCSSAMEGPDRWGRIVHDGDEVRPPCVLLPLITVRDTQLGNIAPRPRRSMAVYTRRSRVIPTGVVTVRLDRR
jgi:hypothetical protein